MEFRTRISRMERIVRNVCNERIERIKRKKRKTGNGNRRWRDSSLLQTTKKSNNFERFFGDLTLTFLTYRNTFRLPILPIRRAVLLCLPLIKIRGRQRKIRGRQILPGCASKSPFLKGKWRKKGGAEAPLISLYKYNTFHRQKQEVLKPKKGLGCGKCFEAVCHNSQSASLLSDSGLVMYFRVWKMFWVLWGKDDPFFSVEVHAVCFIFRKECASARAATPPLSLHTPFKIVIWERTPEKLGAHLGKIRSAPRKNQERT